MGTLTTVGYRDITPTNPSVGIWATLEAACGVLYVAVLIAHLVARVRGCSSAATAGATVSCCRRHTP